MRLHIVLVRTESSGNIGASLRALANMGGDRLILIDCRCEVDSRSRQLAAGAAHLLEGIVHYPSWEAFYEKEGDGLRIAMTRRGGRKRKVFPLEKILEENSPSPPKNLYLIFGPEADGLDAEDLAFINFACHLPVYGSFSSLNLAQAVLLSSFIVRERFPSFPVSQTTGEEEPAVQPFYFPDQLIKEWLTAMGFDIKARKASAYLTLRRLFLQNQPTRHELQVLESILQQNIRKLSLGLPLKKLSDDGRDIASE